MTQPQWNIDFAGREHGEYSDFSGKIGSNLLWYAGIFLVCGAVAIGILSNGGKGLAVPREIGAWVALLIVLGVMLLIAMITVGMVRQVRAYGKSYLSYGSFPFWTGGRLTARLRTSAKLGGAAMTVVLRCECTHGSGRSSMTTQVYSHKTAVDADAGGELELALDVPAAMPPAPQPIPTSGSGVSFQILPTQIAGINNPDRTRRWKWYVDVVASSARPLFKETFAVPVYENPDAPPAAPASAPPENEAVPQDLKVLMARVEAASPTTALVARTGVSWYLSSIAWPMLAGGAIVLFVGGQSLLKAMQAHAGWSHVEWFALAFGGVLLFLGAKLRGVAKRVRSASKP